MTYLFSRYSLIDSFRKGLYKFYFQENGDVYKIYRKKIGTEYYEDYGVFNGEYMIGYINDTISTYSKWVELGFKDGISPGDIENLKELKVIFNRNKIIDDIFV